MSGYNGKSYAEADAYLGRKHDRPLTGRATRLIRRGDDIAVHYQATDVVTYHPDGTITLNTGGWVTMTTRERMSTYAPGWTWTRQQRLYHSTTRPWQLEGDGKPASIVYDGMRLSADGEPLEPRYEQRDAIDAIRKAVKRYVDGFGKAIDAGEIGMPDSGDCWGCLFRDPNDQDRHVMGLSHIDDHINEGYYVPSLLYRACQAKRYGNPELVYQMITERRDGKWGKQTLRWYLNKFYIPQAIADAEQRA